LNEPFRFKCKVYTFLRIVDVFAFADLTQLDYNITKAGCLLMACDMIDVAKKLGAREISEDRMKLSPRKNQLGISFSLIFKDKDSLDKFVGTFFIL